MSAQLAQALRMHARTLRTKSMPLSDLIPLLNKAADALAALEAEPQQEPDLCQNCGDLAYPGCNSEFQGEPACRFWAAPQQEPVAEVYRAHPGGRSRNIGFDDVRPLRGATLPPPGTKLYAAPQQAQAPKTACMDQFCACRGGPAASCEEGEREAELESLRSSLGFYKRRCDLLQQWQSKMRDPERVMVCDILANGQTLPESTGRYALPEVQQAQAPGWRPIETAPKDFVTEFDGWNGERVPSVSWARPEGAAKGEYDWCVSEYISNWGYQNTRVRGLTHWMPLPAAPQQGSKT